MAGRSRAAGTCGRWVRSKLLWGILAGVAAVAVAVWALWVWIGEPAATTFYTSASPDDGVASEIRLAGVRPDGRDDLFDPTGARAGSLPFDAFPHVHLHAKGQRFMEFVLSAPAGTGAIVLDPRMDLYAAGTKESVGWLSVGEPAEAAGGRVRYVISTTMDGEYRRRDGFWFLASASDEPVQRVDLTIRYYHGPRSGGVEFSGPFADGQTVKAAAGQPFEARVSGKMFGLSVVLRSSDPFERPRAILVYDAAGRRHLARCSTRPSRRPSCQYSFQCEGLTPAQAARVTAFEPPRTKTFHNIRVDLPPATAPRYVDRLAGRLGRPGMTLGDLDYLTFASSAEAMKVIDILRGEHISTAADMIARRDKVDFSTLDEATAAKVRDTARRWVREGCVDAGVLVGLAGRWSEFFGLGMTALENGTDAPRWRPFFHGNTASFIAGADMEFTEGMLERLTEYLLRCDRPDAMQLLRHRLLMAKDGGSSAALRRLVEAPFDRPWLWWPAAARLRRRGELADVASLPEPLRERAALAADDGGLPAKKAAELAEILLTAEANRMDPRVCGWALNRLAASAGPAATDAMVAFLRRIDGAAGVGTVVHVVRHLNDWHGVGLCGLAGGADGQTNVWSYLDSSEMIDEVVAWRERGERWRVLPQGYAASDEAVRIVWRNLDDPEDSVIVAWPGLDARSLHIPLRAGGDTLMFRLTVLSGGRGYRWKARTDTLVYGSEKYPRNASSERDSLVLAALPRKVRVDEPNWSGKWEVWAEPLGAVGSVLSGTRLFDAWRAEYIDAMPLQEPVNLVFGGTGCGGF